MEFITSDQRIAVENFNIGRIYTITFKNSSSITRACIGKGADYVMFQETAPKMLFTLNMQTAATVDSIELASGYGTSDYNDLDNKPQINSVTLSGNLSSADLGLQEAISAEDPLPASYVSGLATVATTGAYSDLTGLPTLGTAAAANATDFATAAQGSKADAADAAISAAATGYASLDERLDSMDSNISGKQAALTESQLDAVNSGITSDGVAQIETNKTNILSVYDTGYAKKNLIDCSLTTLKALNNGGTWNGNVYTHNYVTYTINSDMTISIACSTATHSASALYLLSNFKFANKSYSVTGANGGSSETAFLRINSDNDTYVTADTGNGAIFTGESTKTYGCRILVQTNAVVNLTFKPMICDKSLYDVSPTFQPYALSNVELTAAIQAIQAQLANS